MEENRTWQLGVAHSCVGTTDSGPKNRQTDLTGRGTAVRWPEGVFIDH